MNKKGLTISIIFEAESANYGDSIRNTSVLKKIVRKDNKNYSYISRQALRYSIVKLLGWDNTPIEAKGSGSQKVAQFAPDATIKEYPEIDLFGYMKTSEGDSANTRNAVVRLSNAISLEEYKGDTDYLTNMGLAKRNNLDNSIVKSEIHRSFYGYTISIDLDLVGIDKEMEISNEEKAKRINDLLEAVEYLYRDIRGRRENLAPVFVIGGIYNRKNPYFEHRLSLKKDGLNLSAIKDILTDEEVTKNTSLGVLKGIFNNEEEIIRDLNAKTIKEVFHDLEGKVDEYYKSN